MPTDAFQPWLVRWNLTPDGEVITGGYTGNVLLPVIKDGAPAMLKIAHHEDERRGAEVMEWYAGNGAAKVLARDGEALLLERLTGRRSLVAMATSGRDDDATLILCEVAAGLHAARQHPPPSSLIPLATWFRSLEPIAASRGGPFARSLTAARTTLRWVLI